MGELALHGQTRKPLAARTPLPLLDTTRSIQRRAKSALAVVLRAAIGYSATTLLYSGLGLAATFVIGYRWRHELWRRSAPANTAYAGS